MEMLRSSTRTVFFFSHIIITFLVALQVHRAASAVVPSTNCYAFDNSSHLIDFSAINGHTFLYEEEEPDLAVRFCNDVETRSHLGYVDFGRFDKLNYFVAGSGRVDFVQWFYNGDLKNCEKTYDLLGRTARVNVICGTCLNRQCKDELGCICNVTNDSPCRISVELAIPCEKQGPRVFQGFTVGFHPRSWEIVHNGMTQLGFEKSHKEFSFSTEQTRVALYMTAVASLSNLVKRPSVKVLPEVGLEVKLSGSGMTASHLTTLAPAMLILDWRCEKVHDSPYEVTVTIPVEGYEPIEFTLSKMCEFTQDRERGATRGWEIFGILSCISIILSTVFCVGGFVYKTRVEHQRGIDALPGVSILSACLETVSGGTGASGYTRPDLNNTFVNQASWEQQPASSQNAFANQATWEQRPAYNQRISTSERTYGTM